MKKIIALFLLLALSLPLFAGCASSLESGLEETGTQTEEQKETEEQETGEIVYPDTFAVGYATVDISGTPSEGAPIDYYGGKATGIHDPLLLTCVALWDGEKIALVMTADLKKMYGNTLFNTSDVAGTSLKIIEDKFGIPAENVILSCTHSHSAPDAGENHASNLRWQQYYYKQLPVVVEKALRDLDALEGAYTGKSIMEEGVTFVRRYYLESGKVKMSPAASDKPIAHESEADPEMRTIRFDRKNKKDVLLVNFQTHYGNADKLYPSQFSADFVTPFRNQAEKKFDCLFAYYSGASANIGFSSALEGERKYNSFLGAVENAFIPAAERALAAEEKVEVSKIQTSRNLFEGTCMIRSEERVAQVREAGQAGGPTTPEGAALMKKYGIEDDLELQHTLRHANLPETLEVPFTAIAFGDIAFCSTPYEMFDTNGKQVRDGSPFKTTFVCTLSGGALGYVPSALGYENGAYETWNCAFVPGSGEVFAEEIIRLLNECKSGN